MSALGQKRTCAVHKRHVRFTANSGHRTSPYSDVMIFPTVKPAKPPIRAKAHTSQIISYLNL